MDQEAVSHSLIGAVLRDEREAQKLSVEEVCSRLRLSDQQINALELSLIHISEPTRPY